MTAKFMQDSGPDRGSLLQLVSFHVGGEEFGLDILRVQEIIRVPQLTRVPDSPACVDGVINLRGKIIPVVALLNSLLIFVSITAALKAIRELRHRYQAQMETFEVIALQTSKSARVLGLSAPVLLPLLFLAVWLFLLLQ